MFDELTDKLGNVFAKLRGRGVLTEADIKEGMREVRRVLLEADVNFALTREFLERVEKKAVGVLQIKTVQPAQQLVKIVHDELTSMLGEQREGLKMSSVPPTVVMMVGLQGSGKTTTAGKLARKLKLENKSTRLVAADVYRPAAIDQLETLGKALDVPVYADRGTQDVVKIAKAGIDQGQRNRDRVVIVDTAGRLQIDAEMMDELVRLKAAIKPDEILFVADGMTGQEAVKIAQGFNEALDITGVILTKLDGDARGGAALSIYGVLKKPIKYIGVGEKPDALEEFHPERMAGRILQMGDVVSLVEKAQQAFDADEAKKLEKKVRKEGMDLEDFLSAMRQMQKLGPFENLLKLLPGVNPKMLKDVKMDPKRLKHIEAIVLSMTPQERKKPEIINGSRRARIAKGSGRTVTEVNRLLEQFREMQKMMKKMGGMGGGKGGMPRMPFGGGGMFGMR
ncbi:signal recognition particle protein [Gemmatimonas sp. UBA7669]|uniref:signal recognition particle protein n=1 Tax=Gemmatimonas sp. UBA7669 TaxID=1946568 RepID=UPI0025C44EC3|nr:signal recognition particle protein [Gemmatimonas sp. UBA7669]